MTCVPWPGALARRKQPEYIFIQKNGVKVPNRGSTSRFGQQQCSVPIEGFSVESLHVPSVSAWLPWRSLAVRPCTVPRRAGTSALAAGVSACTRGWLLVSTLPCNKLATCSGCSCVFPSKLLGWTPAPPWPGLEDKKKQRRIEWMDVVKVY